MLLFSVEVKIRVLSVLLIIYLISQLLPPLFEEKLKTYRKIMAISVFKLKL
tara:strand:+ start:541 stop:693 length:153 start_codon:yes stop_codon:yes gene_type:complete